MKTGKDIDSIYRDRLKGAKMAPPPDAWDHIQNHLPEEKKKKLFPLWMRLAGVAAVVALIFTFFIDDSNLSSAEKMVSTPAPAKTGYEIPEVSGAFEEIMEESGKLLQDLIVQSGEMKFHVITGAVEKHAEETHNISEGSGQFAEASGPKGRKSEEPEVNFTEETLMEEIPSTNRVAEVSPALQKDESKNSAPKKEESEKKFRLSTRVAPVYFNNFGKGNAVDNSFSQKEAAGQVTFSYGVNVAYEVSEKMNIRSGINKVDLAYNTRQVSFNEIAGTAAFNKSSNEITTLASPGNGTLNQEMRFFEVPLEVEYVVLDKKFAVGLIGGGSVLFLEEARATLNSMGNNTDLGSTYRINNLSFTTNFGLSLGYNMSNKVKLSMEPVVKLPLTTFKDSQDSNPYFFGIYSGFSYKFR